MKHLLMTFGSSSTKPPKGRFPNTAYTTATTIRWECPLLFLQWGSDDFFESGVLSRIWVESVNEEVCKVPDVDYCTGQAEDWAGYRGDYHDPDTKEEDQKRGIERSIYVEEV